MESRVYRRLRLGGAMEDRTCRESGKSTTSTCAILLRLLHGQMGRRHARCRHPRLQREGVDRSTCFHRCATGCGFSCSTTFCLAPTFTPARTELGVMSGAAYLNYLHSYVSSEPPARLGPTPQTLNLRRRTASPASALPSKVSVDGSGTGVKNPRISPPGLNVVWMLK